MNTPLLGIFDSGVGGLSVLKKLRKETSADIVYFGDSANAPYGNRSEEEIIAFIKSILLNLKSQGVEYFISACNSMSVLTTSALLKECGIDESRYIDMIRAFKKHVAFPKDAVVYVSATAATVKSGEYERAFLGKVKSVHVEIFPSLAKSIEDGDGEGTRIVIQESLKEAHKIGATHYVYGCTHYPLVDDVFRSCAQEIGWRGEFVDPAEFVAREVKEWSLAGNRRTAFQTSKNTPLFEMYSRASIEP